MTLKRSFPPVIDAHTRVLICGSLPGERSLAERRYYAHPQNQFWRLVGGVVGVDLPALSYNERLTTLLAHRIGLWDVVREARRSGSSDAAIRDLAANDLLALAETLPDLRAIAFNGGTALKHGLAQLAPRASRWATVALPSSSPLHTVGVEAKRPAWEALRSYLA